MTVTEPLPVDLGSAAVTNAPWKIVAATATSGTAVQAAITALGATGGNIVLLPGPHTWDVIPKLPAALTSKLTISGRGATIQLQPGVESAFLFNRTADGQTFQHLELCDLLVDCNNVTGSHTVLIGTYYNGGWGTYGQRCNFHDIAVRRCRTINVPTGAYTGGAANYSRQNVSIVATDNTSVGTQRTLTDIVVEDCDFQGGNCGVVIMAAGGAASANTVSGVNAAATTNYLVTSTAGFTAGEQVWIGPDGSGTGGGTGELVTVSAVADGTHLTLAAGTQFPHAATDIVVQGSQVNIFQDRITIARTNHDTLLDPAATGTGAFANIQLGGIGYGGRCDIVAFYGNRSGDVGIEIDSFTMAVHDRVVVDDAKNSMFFAKNFNGRVSSSQRYIYRDCTARVVTLNPDTATFNSAGWEFGYPSTFPNFTFANVLMDGCRFRSQATNYTVQGAGVRVNFAPVRRLVIRDFEATLDGISYSTSVSKSPRFIFYAPNLPKAFLTAKGVYMNVAGTVTISGGTFNPKMFYLTPVNSQEVIFDLDNIQVDGSLTGITNGNSYCVDIGAGSGTMHGIVSRFQYGTWSGDTSPKAINIGDGVLTISRHIVIRDCDFGNGGNGFDVNGGTLAALQAKTFVRDCAFNNVQRCNVWPPNRVAKAADYTMTAVDNLLVVTDTSAARTITLPAAAAVPPGAPFVVKDESNAAATNNISVARGGTDTIDGSASSKVINTDSGALRLYSDGVSKWFTA